MVTARQLERVAQRYAKPWPKLLQSIHHRISSRHLLLPIADNNMLGINYESSDEEDVAPVVSSEARPVPLFGRSLIATNGNTSQKPIAKGTTYFLIRT